MKLRISSLILATALLVGALGEKAVAQFGWLFPTYNQPPQQYYPQQQYFPRAPGYAPRGSDEYQPRRSRSYAPPPRRTRAYVEPRRSRRSEAKARARRVVPAAPTPEVAEVDPNTHIAVFGDRLADLVGEGLEEAYDEADDILVVSETRSDGGLADAGAHDWPKIIQEYLATDKKVAFAVVMLGANDRQAIREGEVSHPPLSEPWKEIYGQRVESVLRVFQERRLPVIWVGAPPMREERVSADLLVLNDLVRDRVQRAGAIFVDIWPGFVDNENRYAAKGPDFEGRVTRLRTSEGANFTAAGGRKAAHFVDRELKQLLAARESAAGGAPGDGVVNASLPTSNEPPKPPEKPRERPLVGPVLPLTNAPANSAGGALTTGNTGLQVDPLVNRAFREGLPPAPKPGRADEFKPPS
jgi:hypothetical protein